MSVSILFVRALIEACRASGVGVEDLLRKAAFDAARLDDVDGRLDVEELDRVQSAALDLTGDPALGLHMGERASATAYDVVAYVTSHAATLRSGIESFVKFGRILSDKPSIDLSVQGDVATLRCAPLSGVPRCARLRIELTMTGFYRMIRVFTGPEASVQRVCFEHAAPEYRSEYTRVFDGTEHFEQPTTCIEFASALLDREQLHKNAPFHAMLTVEAERKLNRLTSEQRHANRLRDYLLTTVPRERPDMEAVARGLGMSVRSLRRRLAEEGVSYTTLAEEALAAVAKRLLGDPNRSIYEVAIDMGFADASSFHRAFKRWTGMTPSRYKETL